jgi:hypothetical protein
MTSTRLTARSRRSKDASIGGDRIEAADSRTLALRNGCCDDRHYNRRSSIERQDAGT